MKRTRFQYECNTKIDFPNFTCEQVEDYETLCVWRLKKLYNQKNNINLTLQEKNDIQQAINDYTLDNKDIFLKLNIIPK